MAQIAGCSFTRIQTQCGGDQKTRRREGRRRIVREGFLAIAGDFFGNRPRILRFKNLGDFWKSPLENLGTCGRGSSETACYFLILLNCLQLLETRELQRKSGDLCLIRAHLPQDDWPLFHFGPLPSFPSRRKCSQTSAVAVDQRPKGALQRRVPGSLLSSAGR